MSFIINPHRFGGAASSLLTSLVAFWKLEEASGTRNDSVGSNHLTDNNTVTQQTGKVGNCAQFTATNNEYLSLADNTDLSTGDIDYTFAGWVYFDALGTYRMLITKDNFGTSQREYVLWYNSDSSRLSWNVFDGASTQIGVVLANNLGAPSTATWYFIVAWHDAASNLVGIQVNNGTADTAATSGAAGDSTAAFQIGKREADTLPHDGRIDAVGFWKRILTADEKTTLYNSGNGLEHPFS